MNTFPDLSPVAGFALPRLNRWLATRYTLPSDKQLKASVLGEALKPAVRDSGELIDHLGLSPLVSTLSVRYGTVLFLDTLDDAIKPIYEATVRRFAKEPLRAFEFVREGMDPASFCRELGIVPVSAWHPRRIVLSALRTNPDMLVATSDSVGAVLPEMLHAGRIGHKVFVRLRGSSVAQVLQALERRCADEQLEGHRFAAALLESPMVIVFRDSEGRLVASEPTVNVGAAVSSLAPETLVRHVKHWFDILKTGECEEVPGRTVIDSASTVLEASHTAALRQRMHGAAENVAALLNAEYGVVLKRSKSLELLAHLLGQPNWNTLCARGPAEHLLQLPELKQTQTHPLASLRQDLA